MKWKPNKPARRLWTLGNNKILRVAPLCYITIMQDAVVRARVDSSLKNDTEKVFDKLGLTTTEAIRLFLAQVKLRGGLPFEVRLPSDNSDLLLPTPSRQASLDAVFDD